MQRAACKFLCTVQPGESYLTVCDHTFGRSNELPLEHALYATCVTTHTLRGQRHGGLCPRANYSKHAASVSLSTASLLASEIRLGRVLNTVKSKGSPTFTRHLSTPVRSRTELMLWWNKVFNSELTLASLLWGFVLFFSFCMMLIIGFS